MKVGVTWHETGRAAMGRAAMGRVVTGWVRMGRVGTDRAKMGRLGTGRLGTGRLGTGRLQKKLQQTLLLLTGLYCKQTKEQKTVKIAVLQSLLFLCHSKSD
jgi:hypothetical protein